MKVRVPSRSTAGVFYDVVVGLDGSVVCNCPASFNRLKCWHVAYVREEMNMTTETRALVPIVVQPSVALLPSYHDLDVVERAAAMVYAGGVSLPRELNTKEKVAAVMLYGLELGLKPMTAIQHLYIVEGKVAASAQVMVGLCMNKERDIEFHIEELNARVCTIRMIRPSRHVNEVYTVTWDMIHTAGLDRGNNVKYPEDRLTYHCTKRLCRIFAPDLINGLADGVVVPGITAESEWREQPIDASEFYNEGDAPANVDRETGEIMEASPEPGLAQDDSQQDDEPEAPTTSRPVAAGDISEMLGAIASRHGQPAKIAAINVMSRFFDTQVVTKLNPDERADYAAMLRVRLDGIEHEHEGAFTAYGHPVCLICGEDVKPPESAETAPAKQPSMV